MNDAPVALLAAAAVVGYLLGSISPATLLARSRGADLRAAGSGNPGATNVGRVLGRRAGVAVGIADVVKGAVPALLFGLLAEEAGLLAGFAAVLGHVTSPFLRGRGGRGVATALGAIVGSHPKYAPLVLVTWVLVLVVARWVGLASVAAALALPAVALVLRADAITLLWAVALAAVVVVRHRENGVQWVAARRARRRTAG